MNFDQKYDIAILGAGLGGLMCGLILARSGYKILLVEKNQKLGGNFQVFKRKGVSFNTGMHYAGSLDEGQILNRIFKYVGICDDLKLQKLDKNCFDKIILRDNEYDYAQGFDNFTEVLGCKFPDEKQSITDFVDTIKKVVACNKYINNASGKAEEYAVDIFEPVSNFLKSISANSELRDVLSALNSLYAGKPEETPLSVHATINHFFINSAYRFVNGSGQIVDIMEKHISELGGDILRHSEVKSIDLCNDNIESVTMANGEKIFAGNYISSMHPNLTFSLIEGGNVRKSYFQRFKNSENTIGMFSVYAILKKNKFPYKNYNIHQYKNDIWGVRSYNSTEWPDGFMMYTPATDKSGKYAESLIIMSYMSFEELRKWENTTVGRRGEDYKEFKMKKAEKLLDAVAGLYPEIRESVDEYYTSTPLTFRDYTNTQQGSAYGFVKNIEHFTVSLLNTKTKISNLFLTGQNIYMHGILGVSVGSILTCESLPVPLKNRFYNS